MSASPEQVVRAWVDAFNAGDVDGLERLYAEDAVNHQVAYEPLHGRSAIRALFEREFARARMVCVIENLFVDGDRAILEWSDPLGLRGCGIFHVADGRIVHQRGYFDKLSFYRAQGLPLEKALEE
ncbi:nuclear transport factor 2 family protein [Marinicauda sp. Alg238-R41]|uniref:nuclear transport factor 2 family protein n=1 Tax=Marinicauda sp. Alg238-R41 TaxID=2993447 RepID=UPI0022E45CFB|nr:nuclear transport factor 2 family protein [Marinicauda sp. Alg238-R41]